MKLSECMSDLVNTGEYNDVLAYKLRDITVASEHYSHQTRWPGPHKNVHFWVILSDGRAVGWNESPSRGYSFPVLSKNKVKHG